MSLVDRQASEANGATSRPDIQRHAISLSCLTSHRYDDSSVVCPKYAIQADHSLTELHFYFGLKGKNLASELTKSNNTPTKKQHFVISKNLTGYD